MFDVDRDGVLSRDELHEMVVALLEVWKDNRTDTLPVSPHTHTHTYSEHRCRNGGLQNSRNIQGKIFHGNQRGCMGINSELLE